MSRNGWIGAALAAVFAAVLAGCGGGSGSMSGGTGTGGTGTGARAVSASGTVTSFGSGSVSVNGSGFATGSGTAVVDGDNDDSPTAISAVQVGMTVDVDGTSSAMPTATFVRITSAVRGEVDATDTTGSTMTVLGQNVRVTSGTSFFGSNSKGTALTSLGDVVTGDYVVVYGYVEQCPSTPTAGCPASGTQVVATLIAQPAKAGRYRVAGLVTALGATAGTFSINGLTVTTTASGSSATTCVPAGCTVAVGDFVEVRSATAPTGMFSATVTPPPLTLAADVVRVRKESPAFASGATVQVEGPLSKLDTTKNVFVVRGLTIDGSGLASTVATLVDQEIVDVTGTVSADGSIKATQITVEQHATLAVLGQLTAVDGTADTLTVLGQTFDVTAKTRFVDWSQETRPFDQTNFATVLQANDYVIVSGYPAAGGVLTATRVERIPTPSKPIAGVQGIVTADTAGTGSLTIGGLTGLDVTVNGSTMLFYPGAGKTPTEAGFFAAIVPNVSVAIVLGTSSSTSSTTTTITAADAAVLSATCGWAHDDGSGPH